MALVTSTPLKSSHAQHESGGTLRRAEERLEAYSLELSSEAAYYWRRHQPRFRYMASLVERFQNARPIRRVLDIGMGFEALLLRELLPESRIECLGIGLDDRFRPCGDFHFHALDLNDLAVAGDPCSTLPRDFDLIIFMEVLEHLYTPPDVVLRYLASHLVVGGTMLVTTPNAAWLKNRIKLACGKNPFETLRVDRKNMGHVREYTKRELEVAVYKAGLEIAQFARLGLYRFNGRKDRFYSAIADLVHPSLSRTLAAVCTKPDNGLACDVDQPPSENVSANSMGRNVSG